MRKEEEELAFGKMFEGGFDVKLPTDGPRWKHRELVYRKGKFINARKPEAKFLSRWGNYDVYVARKFFCLRWGREQYVRRYGLSEPGFDRAELPEKLREAIRAASTLLFGLK